MVTLVIRRSTIKGNGIAVVDGSIVENLHAERAHRVLGVNATGKMNED